ncbi:MAG: phytanoyl-CoA dioxygenase [Sphingomonas bacterium]|uniref:phytanoyl-CoA dioxygenase family protein n=1 Tax=Sphingomonas bacterium TaxID=1895847 RepID=UPI00262F5D39|nr:phytanoyl-CoA dioxygenase family protein [Sphingomonas bacterium]MDB5707965.1 phytanoyl-CoA dioxygenase [Sphingomonas bacterium]
MSPDQLTIEHHGAALYPGAALSILDDLEAALAGLPADQAGVRLHGIPGLAALLDGTGVIGRLVADRQGENSRAVRAILFDKSATANWALGWHQDRTIAVRERVDTKGFGPWSVKVGITHVEPPFALLETMLTMRIHLDPVPDSNAPLLIAPGSHRLGRIAERDIDASVARCGTFACTADRGDTWIYATPILHASARAVRPQHRRVLQVDFCAQALPPGLDWLGI